jgi:hypothetical protein
MRVWLAELVQLLGLLCFVAAGFWWSPVVGFLVLAAVLLTVGVAIDPRVRGRR